MSEDEKAKERWDNEGGHPLKSKMRTGQIISMSKITELNALITNKLLARLPGKEYRRLFPSLENVALNYGEHVYERGDVIDDVYFPSSGIVSLLTTVENSGTLEVGIIGNEGMLGLSVFLGVKTSNNRAVIQGEGSAMKLKSRDFLKECSLGGALPKILRRFTHSLLTQISQSAFCFRFHTVEARLARWLLMSSDRMESNEFPITQDFLANMLGVRREAVNKSAVILQDSKLIEYSRGKMHILDHSKLEKSSCPCYAIIKTEEQSLTLN